MKDSRVMILGPRSAVLAEVDFDAMPLAGEVLGCNLVSLISTGSECNGYTQTFPSDQYPMPIGSSSIARVMRVGEGVTRYREGDLFFHDGHHARYARVNAEETVPVPETLSPEAAIFSRYAAVSMTSIHRMRAKAPDKVLVTGLGLVGLMCAQVLDCMGFGVHAVDASPVRRAIAQQAGVTQVAASFDAWPELAGGAGALLACSGDENALRAAIPYLRPGSDAFQVGVPWRSHGDWDAHGLLHELFYSYVSLHGGWEWYLPKASSTFEIHGSRHHIGAAMQWIAQGRMRVVPDMYERVDPAACDAAYARIAAHDMRTTALMFDWCMLAGKA